jgi:hypothetical protein
MTNGQAWELAIVLTGTVYVAASLIGGLQSPSVGLLVVGAAGIKLLVSLWLRNSS